MYLNFFFFSAPANLRFGHSCTNSKIQENFDPMTCGLNWNLNNNCVYGMTPKEQGLLARVYGPNQVDIDAALARTDLVNGAKYFCSNCHKWQLNNAGTFLWYYMA